MQTSYFTKRGSIYTHKVDAEKEIWFKEDRAGEMHSLAGGVYITIRKLQKLVSDYPLLLDRTYAFDMGVEKEFFEEAKKEQFKGDIGDEETIIFFLIKKEFGTYGIGSSSLIERIETEETESD